MYEIGDMVVVNEYEKQVVGKIVSWHFDEGDVWTVRMPGGQQWDFCNSELSLPVLVYGYPSTYRPAHSGG